MSPPIALPNGGTQVRVASIVRPGLVQPRLVVEVDAGDAGAFTVTRRALEID